MLTYISIIMYVQILCLKYLVFLKYIFIWRIINLEVPWNIIFDEILPKIFLVQLNLILIKLDDKLAFWSFFLIHIF